MDRKFQTLILALEMALPFETNIQEGFEQFLTGRLQLRDAVGNKLNPYDYIGKTGQPLIRFTTESQEKVAERLNFAEKRPAVRKGSPACHQTVAPGTNPDSAASVQACLRQLSETFDKSHRRQSWLCQRCLRGIEVLSRIFEVLRSEEEARQDGLSTSFAHVEKAIATYIAGCLSDYPSRKRGIRRIRALVRDYRVVTPLRDGSPSVSLGRVYSLIEDNFQGSCLRKFLGIMIAGHMNTTTQVMTF